MTDTTIYSQHDAAFRQVSAYVIARNGERVATIAFKFPKDGAGRLYAYVHWLGLPMVRGYAGGYGYDKRSASVASAARHISAPKPEDLATWERDKEARESFVAAIAKDGGQTWDSCLRAAGFDVWQAV